MEIQLATIFESVCDAVPERTALVCGDDRLSYAQLDARANRLAHWFSAAGIGAGDHVGLYLYNGTAYLEAMLACFKLSAVPINVNYRYVAGELSYLADNADLKALLYQQDLCAQVEAALAEFPLRFSVAVDSPEYSEGLAKHSPGRDFPQRSGDDLYVIYTGGTTGMPRGVMWRHKDLYFAGLQGGNPGGEPLEDPSHIATGIAEGRMSMNILPAAPLIHGSSQFAGFICLFTGGTVSLVPGRSFSAAKTAALVGPEQIMVVNLVGDAMARPLAEEVGAHPDRYDTSSLMVIASAGAILSEPVRIELSAAFPNAMILNNFGASETGHQGAAFYGETGEKPKWFMNESTAVLDEQLRPVEPGSGVIGKIARGGHIPLGYYKDEAKTAATFVVIDGKRWVIPGDMATVEGDGSITFLGRGAVCINTGGEKVFPEEVEGVLKGHAQISDALVVGVPHPRWGEEVCALVVSREVADRQSFEAHCRANLAGYKVPRRWIFCAEVPRHPSGKPDYSQAKQRALDALEQENRS